jgi:hypothetical protein
MTGERRAWTIGGLSRDDAGCTVTKAHEITEVEFAELERKVTFVIELASQTDYGRLLAAVARLDASPEAAREERGGAFRGRHAISGYPGRSRGA